MRTITWASHTWNRIKLNVPGQHIGSSSTLILRVLILSVRMCIQFCPTHAMAMNNLGVIEKNVGNVYHFHHNVTFVRRSYSQIPQAIEYYKQALKANPKFAQTLNNIGVIYTMIGQVLLPFLIYKTRISLSIVIVLIAVVGRGFGVPKKGLGGGSVVCGSIQ